MSRVQNVRGVIPRLYHDLYELEFWYTGNGSATFDPSITTSQSTSIVWRTSDGQNTTTSGTTHNFSYTPASGGPYRCVATVIGGLRLVTVIDCNTDAVTGFKNISKLKSLASFVVYTNTSLVFNINDLSGSTLTNINFQGTTPGITGSIESLPSTLVSITLDNVSNVTGSINNLKSAILTTLMLRTDTGITGSVGGLSSSIQSCQLNSSTSIAAASIVNLVVIRDLRVGDIGWNATSVDTVLLSASDAVWADANHYTYSSPSLQIGGTNAAPGGSSGADTTDPMTTPGSGNSDTNWEWDAGKSAHKALTGKAAVYYLTHLASHTWAITYTS